MAMNVVSGFIGFIDVKVTSSLTTSAFQNRFSTSITVKELKGKLELVTGATATLSELHLFNNQDEFVCILQNDDVKVDTYPVENNFRIHVINHDPTKIMGEFEDVSKVEKYELPDEAYAKRTDTVMAFKKKMKMGRFADVDPEAKAAAAAKEEKEKEEAEAIPIGSRCEVTIPGSAMRKRGTVMFVGKTHFKSGYFVGVKYDEPLGKNDGSVDEHRYFECPPKYGAFLKAKLVQVGDFPEETFDSDDEM